MADTPTTPSPLDVPRVLQLRAKTFGFPVKGAMVDRVEAHIGQPIIVRSREHQVYNPIECPYCHQPMTIYDGDVFVRIVGMANSRESTAPPQTPVLAEIGHKDLLACTCVECRETFWVSRHSLGQRPR